MWAFNTWYDKSCLWTWSGVVDSETSKPRRSHIDDIATNCVKVFDVRHDSHVERIFEFGRRQKTLGRLPIRVDVQFQPYQNMKDKDDKLDWIIIREDVKTILTKLKLSLELSILACRISRKWSSVVSGTLLGTTLLRRLAISGLQNRRRHRVQAKLV